MVGSTPRRERYDLIVVGLGAMGSAVVHHARRRGLSVLGLDRHDPPHHLGSTHGETRITRLAVGEGPEYLRFVARSHELWREIEAEIGVPLLHPTGGLIITESGGEEADRWTDFTVATAEVAAEAGIDYALLDGAELADRYPMLAVPHDAGIGFEPSAGVVMAEAAVAAQLSLARSAGAIVRTGETVVAVEPTVEVVDVVTDADRYSAGKVVLAAGPWLPEMVTDDDRAELGVTRQVMYWFEADELDRFRAERFPFVMWIGHHIDDYLGIFPVPTGSTPAVKVLGEQFATTTTAAEVDRSVSPAEVEEFFRHKVEPRLSGVGPRCVNTAVCLYTNTADDHFLIDTDPRSDRIVLMSPCSGHGFKHSAALGEAVAELVAEGTTTLDLSPFRRRGRR